MPGTKLRRSARPQKHEARSQRETKRTKDTVGIKAFELQHNAGHLRGGAIVWARSSALIALLALACAACDRPVNSNTPNGLLFAPVGIVFASAAHIQPAVVPVVAAPVFFCPASPPLSTSFALVISASSSDLFLNQVAVTVNDVNGLAGAPTLISPAGLTTLFGILSVPAGTTRSFPLSAQFGCGLAAPSSLVVVATLGAGAGGSHEMTATARFAP
jgi:hypothetical protein